MFDAHVHLRDSRILPYHARFVKECLDAGVTACIDCACTPIQWATEPDCSLEVIPAYGLHPWQAGVAPPDWVEILRWHLCRHPEALVGEFGLDGLRRVSDGGSAQRAAFRSQIALAARLERPAVLHGAKCWMTLLTALSFHIRRLPAVMLHGVSFAPDMLRLPIFKNSNIWFGIGGAVLSPNAKNLPRFVRDIPLNRLLLETDSPDMFPCGGDPLVLGQYRSLFNHPGNLPHILRRVAELRGMPPEELAQITEANTRAFLAARG